MKRWDLGNGDVIEDYRFEEARGSNAISPSGRFLLASDPVITSDGHVWDIEKKTKIATIKVNSKRIICATIDKRDKIVVTGGGFGDVIVHELESGKLIKQFRGEPFVRDIDPAIEFVDISPDGKTVAAWDRNEVVRLWNIADGKLMAAIPKIKCPECRFTPNGEYLVTMNLNLMELRSPKDGKVLRSLGNDTKKKVFIAQFMFSDDGKTAALASSTGTVHIWSIPELK